MSPKRKSKKRLSKIISYFIILLSLLIIFSSITYYNSGFVLFKKDDQTITDLDELYMKNQYETGKNQTARLAIRNGCGKQNLGLIYKRYLLDVGYDITESSNADHFGHTSTKIFFHKENKKLKFFYGARRQGWLMTLNLNQYKQMDFQIPDYLKLWFGDDWIWGQFVLNNGKYGVYKNRYAIHLKNTTIESSRKFDII